MNKKYNELKKIIVKAVPDIMELKFGCKIEVNDKYIAIINEICDEGHFIYAEDCVTFEKLTIYKERQDFKIIGRDITLEDVLCALPCELYTGFHDGYIECGDEHTIWAYHKPLHKQSEETIDFLLSILKK